MHVEGSQGCVLVVFDEVSWWLEVVCTRLGGGWLFTICVVGVVEVCRVGALAGAGGRLCACAVLQIVRRFGWCDGEDTLLQVAVWVWVCARLEEYFLPYGGVVWIQVSGGGDWWVCSGRGSWHPLVLVALEGLRVRVRVDRTPGRMWWWP